MLIEVESSHILFLSTNQVIQIETSLAPCQSTVKQLKNPMVILIISALMVGQFLFKTTFDKEEVLKIYFKICLTVSQSIWYRPRVRPGLTRMDHIILIVL